MSINGSRQNFSHKLMAEIKKQKPNLHQYLKQSTVCYRDGVVNFSFNSSESFLLPLVVKAKPEIQAIAYKLFDGLIDVEFGLFKS